MDVLVLFFFFKEKKKEKYLPVPPEEQTKIIALPICIQALPLQTDVRSICTATTGLLQSPTKSRDEYGVFTTLCEIFVTADCLCILQIASNG